ncbi:MAG: hypothetical protein H6922_02285 [Pseudomonadaceae bacterium]|nr:hypothetical protein [Pseudomonadaceae bacterium]
MKTNPKTTLIRNACKALSPTFRRAFGEVGRTVGNPANAIALRDGLANSVLQLLKAEFGKTGLPVVTPQQAQPDGEHWLIESLGGSRNFLHGRLPVSVHMAYVDETGACPLGAVYFPVEDVLVLAEKGSGTIGPERLRTAARTTLEHSLFLLPLKTGDLPLLSKLLEQAEDLPLHTRKTGHTLFDAIDVAAGRADGMAATRLNRLEALLAGLILAESGAQLSQLDGAPFGAASDTLLAANLKLHPLFLAAING